MSVLQRVLALAASCSQTGLHLHRHAVAGCIDLQALTIPPGPAMSCTRQLSSFLSVPGSVLPEGRSLADPGANGISEALQAQFGHARPDASHSLVITRGMKLLRRRFALPPDIAAAVKQELEAARVKPPAPEVPPVKPRALKASSRRVGCIAYKAGMTQEWNEHGVRIPLTVLWIDDCQVVGLRWPELHGYWGLQVGAGWKHQRNLHPAEAGFYLKQEVPFKAFMREFRVSKDGMLPVGTSITAAHYVAGQCVDITGWNKNKGFQGVMKRWGFKGLPASHGVSLAHRSPGSIGNRTSPGKVWKGKKMPGQMGDEQVTLHNCLVYKVDPARNLVYIKGTVPGPAGQEVLLRDALNTRHEVRQGWALPHPTATGPGGAVLSDLGRAGMVLALAAAHGEMDGQELVQSGLLPAPETVPEVQVFRGSRDPYIPYSKETDYFEVKWKKGD